MKHVHLLVCVHGMWGSPDDLHELALEATTKLGNKEGAEYEFDILVPENNSGGAATYDGVDWCGERVADEVQAKIAAIEEDGEKRVARFSITGYSLGGLVSRYLIGILHSRKFFDSVKPVNFTTFATPHIGLPKYPTWISKIMASVGPKLLSRTGEQFYCTDSYASTGKPLLQVMADPNQIFYHALSLFQHKSIYGSVINDMTVPYVTALIDDHDSYADHEAQGMTFVVDKRYSPLLVSFSIPDSPPSSSSKPHCGTKEYWRSLKPRPIVTPAAHIEFPLTIPIYLLLPVMIPLFATIGLSKLVVESKQSRKRVKLLERDESIAGKLSTLLREMEYGIEHVVVETVDDPGVDEATPTAAVLSTASSSDTLQRSRPPSPTLPANSSPLSAAVASGMQPELLPVQLEIVASLNRVPELKKYGAYFPDVRNSHGLIINRDAHRVPSLKRFGEGVLRHWVDHWEL